MSREPNKRQISLSLLCLVPLLALAVSACNGSGGSSDSNSTSLSFINASLVIGQAGFTSGQPNRGGTTDATTLSGPTGRACGSGPFYVTDSGNNRVLGYNSVPTSLNATPSFVLGQTDFTSNGTGTTATTLFQPQDCWSDGTRLFVVDTANNRVLIWSPAPTSGGTAATIVLGQTNFTSNSPADTATGMESPSAVAAAGGRLFVADSANNRVLVWNSIPTSSGTVASIALGQPNLTSTSINQGGINPTAGTLSGPSGVWTDGQRLIVADTNNHRVLIWNSIPTTNGAVASLVIGQQNFTTASAALSVNALQLPTGVHSDGTRIFIADTGHNRVLVFNNFPLFNQPGADIVLGQADFVHSGANDNNQDGSIDASPSARTMNLPTGVFVANNQAFVSDRNNHRIMVFASPY